jgi:hypothetical protein
MGYIFLKNYEKSFEIFRHLIGEVIKNDILVDKSEVDL